MQDQQINDLVKKMSEQASANHIDKEPSKVEMFLQMQLQLFKAYELRNQNWNATEKLIGRLEVLMNDTAYPQMSKTTFIRLYKNYIENTTQGYITNCVVLLLEYAAIKRLTIKKESEEYPDAKYKFPDFVQILLNMNAAFEFLYSKKVTGIEISDIIFYLEELATYNGFDLWQMVNFSLCYTDLSNTAKNSRKNFLKKIGHDL